ncbi:hypothetical protein P4H42_03530 [Paenibacillus macerans]|uniref:hypothetical protein n=1 Tax=Paenibacillus macerans TaxID=44252 RepID=UPI002DB5CBFA|nr:hypothetical protein [Paenibacillus macerans]MEC0328693.1 hypothetical protein [Paenibacillus macerans]
MKATIYGVQVEGTPQEIVEYARLVGDPLPSWMFHPPTIPNGYGWKPYEPQITCGGTK